MTGRWFAAETTAPDAVARLFCLPHAGAGASAYREWQSKVGPDVEVVPVQLPGREARFAEPPVTSAAEIVKHLAGSLVERAGGKPFALFGHSMGALLAYELTHELLLVGRPPVHLVVSGYGAPHLPRSTAYGVVHKLPDAELARHIEALQGTAGEVLEHPELLELLLPILRADYELCETYRFVGHPPLPVPVTALGGTEDPGATEPQLRAWGELTTAPFTATSFPGGHFYLNAQLDDLTRIARDAVLPPASRD
ncbi:thioesterase II family protein [Streptomyces tailanensis]|uniref:thioesterase II family protein n=1 Tax=Streptomyces tailanensis TaxID=2569858 RepID=UPI001FE90FBC|nr:alpha/beta fold hydrolase [Streptomyces tailanensis]